MSGFSGFDSGGYGNAQAQGDQGEEGDHQMNEEAKMDNKSKSKDGSDDPKKVVGSQKNWGGLV